MVKELAAIGHRDTATVAAAQDHVIVPGEINGESFQHLFIPCFIRLLVGFPETLQLKLS